MRLDFSMPDSGPISARLDLDPSPGSMKPLPVQVRGLFRAVRRQNESDSLRGYALQHGPQLASG